ncbi:MAG TPA: hypothetical protein VGD17_10750 [Chitinophagaceae bacterium]
MEDGDHIKLQCINKKCHYSGHGQSEISIFVDVKGYKDSIHFCPLCQHPLVSEIDVALFSLLIETGITTEDFR